MKSVCSRLSLLILLAAFACRLHAQETQKLYLSGTGNDQTVKWQFYCTEGRNSGKWTTIPVPSNWELHGFGKYNYGFNKDENRGKEKGLYKYDFKVPAAWKGKKVNIVFEGSMTDTEVKINGKSAGPVHQGAYYAFRYDISDLVKYGATNRLEATVAKHSENKSVNEAERIGDFWIFGGIFRPVYLEALPEHHIERIALDAKADGSFKANVWVANKGASEVSAQIYTIDGKKVGAPFTSRLNANDTITKINTTVPSPLLWTSETPNLYRVEVSLLQNGKAVHTVSKRFGFRTVEVKERDGVYVNGVKVKFKGVNRHSFWPTSGRTMSKKLSLLDVQVMKDMNMNAVRMSHYPPDDHFLDVCDSLGLFVLDELAGWHGNYDTPTGTRLTRQLIAHDENHPSVIFWINGNEGGHNYDLDAVFDDNDIQRRPVIHAWEDFRGFDTQHYREFDYGIGNYMHGHSIVMPTEFLHGMYDGGHGAGIEDYWEKMWQYPLSAGGFLWDFADAGVVRTDKNGELDTDGNRAADGIVGSYREKEGSFFTIKEVWSPVYFAYREITPSFDGTFELENRYHFTNLNQCTFSWKLSKVIDPSGQRAAAEKTGTATAPSIKPLEKGTLKLSLPGDWQQYDFLYVTVIDPHKRELFTWSWPISKPNTIAKGIVVTEGPGTVNVSEIDSLYKVSANGINLSINKRNGVLQGVQNAKGVIPFTNGPVVEQGVNNFGGFTHRYEGKNLVIASTFDKKNSYNTMQWTVYPSGWVQLKISYFPGSYFTDYVGVNFSFPEKEIKSVQWMGNGPYRVWKNRMKGNNLGLWEKAYNNTSTGEPPVVYPEFKGYHSNLYWCKLVTTGQPITVVTPQEDIFLRLYTPRFGEDTYKNMTPVFPSGDISFMQGISGIGTKTQKTETTGPMGMKNIYYDYEKEPKRAKELVLFFDFSGK